MKAAVRQQKPNRSITPTALLASASRMWSHRPAVVDGDLRFSYGQLATAVEFAAADLKAQGVQPGDRVAHLGKLSVVHSVLLFACARLDAVYVPLDAWAAWPAIETMLSLAE